MATFIEPKKLSIQASVPALVGMGLGAITSANTHSQIGAFGEAIGALVQTYQDNKNMVSDMELTATLSDLDNQFNMEILSNPTSMDTEEGRQYVLSMYNTLIENKRQRVEEYRKHIGDINYTNQIMRLKKQTENEAYQLQVGINQGYLKNEMAKLIYAEDTNIASMQLAGDTDNEDAYEQVILANQKINENKRLLGGDTEQVMIPTIQRSEDTYITSRLHSVLDVQQYLNEDGTVDYEAQQSTLELTKHQLLNKDRLDRDTERHFKATLGKVPKDVIRREIINIRQLAFDKMSNAIKGRDVKQKQLQAEAQKLDLAKVMETNNNNLNQLASGNRIKLDNNQSIVNILNSDSVSGKNAIIDIKEKYNLHIPMGNDEDMFVKRMESINIIKNEYNNIINENGRSSFKLSYGSGLIESYSLTGLGANQYKELDILIDNIMDNPSGTQEKDVRSLNSFIKKYAPTGYANTQITNSQFVNEMGNSDAFNEMMRVGNKKMSAKFFQSDKSGVTREQKKELFAYLVADIQYQYDNGLLGEKGIDTSVFTRDKIPTVIMYAMNNEGRKDGISFKLNEVVQEGIKKYNPNNRGNYPERYKSNINNDGNIVAEISVRTGNIGNLKESYKPNELNKKQQEYFIKNLGNYKTTKENTDDIGNRVMNFKIKE